MNQTLEEAIQHEAGKYLMESNRQAFLHAIEWYKEQTQSEPAKENVPAPDELDSELRRVQQYKNQHVKAQKWEIAALYREIEKLLEAEEPTCSNCQMLLHAVGVGQGLICDLNKCRIPHSKHTCQYHFKTVPKPAENASFDRTAKTSNTIETRPWGHYEVLLDADNCKVKRITVNSGGRLSLQYHHKRSEHWIVIAGTAHVTIGEDIKVVEAGESCYLPLRAKHRVQNLQSEPLVFIEVQTGTYFGEDDIVRIEDDYNRI
jgi:mannose-6-phosphate isomerase-like protein (cupin superfamily)